MPRFGPQSLTRLEQAHPDLQNIFYEVIEIIDCSILCSYRGEEEQERAFREGRSRKHFPDSKHNYIPSRAVDCIPYPVNWRDLGAFHALANVVLEIADKHNVPIVWGGMWQGFPDYPHYELPDYR